VPLASSKRQLRRTELGRTRYPFAFQFLISVSKKFRRIPREKLESVINRNIKANNNNQNFGLNYTICLYLIFVEAAAAGKTIPGKEQW